MARGPRRVGTGERVLRWSVFLALVAALAGWVLSAPRPLDAALLSGLEGDAEAGRDVFHAAGCAGCHIAPGAAPSDAPLLAGGQRFVTEFGTFVAPNISPSEAGIGGWSDAELLNAILRGVGPEGQHYYPAFPYTSYTLADPQDMADLVAYLRELPPDPTPSLENELGFPFNLRRGIGLWKRLNMPGWVMTEVSDPEVERGRMLVEALGHCAECHTPRTLAGGLDRARWMEGAPLPSGEGSVPAITPSGLGWNAFEIAYYLETGFTPSFDSAGGAMTEVIHNTSRLPPEDRAAIAAYLVALP